MTSSVLVVTGERNWSLRALHLAAAMARTAGVGVVMARFVRVAHMEYLGAGAREALLWYEEYDDICEYARTAEAYGVPFSVEMFEYNDYSGGLVSAAEHYDAAVVFAPAPSAIVEPLANLRLWWLRRTLGRPLYVLGRGDGPMAWTETAAPAPNAAARPNISAHQP